MANQEQNRTIYTRPIAYLCTKGATMETPIGDLLLPTSAYYKRNGSSLLRVPVEDLYPNGSRSGVAVLSFYLRESFGKNTAWTASIGRTPRVGDITKIGGRRRIKKIRSLVNKNGAVLLLINEHDKSFTKSVIRLANIFGLVSFPVFLLHCGEQGRRKNKFSSDTVAAICIGKSVETFIQNPNIKKTFA